MKKKILLASLLLASLTAAAQPGAGTFSIIPRLGVCLARTGDKVYVADASSAADARYKAGLTGGVDLEVQAMPSLAVSLGALYSMQGCRYGEGEYATSQKNETRGIRNMRTELSYLSIPLMGHCYVTKGLAVGVGVALDIALDGKLRWDETPITATESGDRVMGETREVKSDCRQKRVGVSVPLGLSYEYMNVVVDARYNIGLTHVFDLAGDNTRMSSLMLTVGYRFAL